MFKCSGCGNEREDAERVRKYGQCVTCQRAYTNARYAAKREQIAANVREWKALNAERVSAQRSAKRSKETNPDWRARENARQRAYRAADPKREAELSRASREKHREARNVGIRRWKETNKHIVYADNAARRARQSTGIAKFFKSEIAAIYAACPKGFHVDHVHPLRIFEGKEHVACGLHVPWNLQYLTVSANRRKRNLLG